MKKWWSFIILFTINCGGVCPEEKFGEGVPIEPGQYKVIIKKTGNGTCNFFTDKDIEFWNIRKSEENYSIILHGISINSNDGLNFYGNTILKSICDIDVVFMAQVNKDKLNSFTGEGQIYANYGICGSCEDFATLNGTINIKK